MSKVLLKEVVKGLGLEVIYGTDYLDRKVLKTMSSRPAVELYAGYFDYFEVDRIQVIGTKEITIFHMLSENDKKERIIKLFSYNSPAYIFTKNVEVPKEFVEIAIQKHMPLLKSCLSTSALIGDLTSFLSTRLADRISVEGAMLDVYGIGVLLQGEAGIGKSETALELIKRGHILIADDETRIYQKEQGYLVAEAPKVTEKLMNIKDIGVVNVINLFGVGAYRNQKHVMLVIELVKESTKICPNQRVKFFDTEVPKLSILVESGRNIASLVETAAMNNRLKGMGQSGDDELALRVANSPVRPGK